MPKQLKRRGQIAAQDIRAAGPLVWHPRWHEARAYLEANHPQPALGGREMMKLF